MAFFLNARGRTTSSPLKTSDLKLGSLRIWSSSTEKLGDYVDIEVEPLKNKHLLKAVKGHQAAFKDDPVIRWSRGGKSEDPMERVVMTWFFAIAVGRKVAITVDGGTAVVVASGFSPSDRKRGAKEVVVDWITSLLVRSLSSKERLEKGKELGIKMEKVKAAKIGDREKDMVYVDLVFTAPEAQGQGYASALLGTITDLADKLGRAAWLVSGNIKNEGFYNLHGFQNVGDIIVGDDDPTWHEKPVVLQLMVREPIPATSS